MKGPYKQWGNTRVPCHPTQARTIADGFRVWLMGNSWCAITITDVLNWSRSLWHRSPIEPPKPGMESDKFICVISHTLLLGLSNNWTSTRVSPIAFPSQFSLPRQNWIFRTILYVNNTFLRQCYLTECVWII